jgi:hypothetical protein
MQEGIKARVGTQSIKGRVHRKKGHGEVLAFLVSLLKPGKSLIVGNLGGTSDQSRCRSESWGGQKESETHRGEIVTRSQATG